VKRYAAVRFGGTPFAGTLSVDGIGSYAQNAVNLSNFTGTCATLTTGPFKGQTGCSDGIPMFYGPDDLKGRCRTTPALCCSPSTDRVP
jgi:hypothetical protein